MERYGLKLFWYKTQCSQCGHKKENVHTPHGNTYEEKYQDFAIYCGSAGFFKAYELDDCPTCKRETQFVITHHAPAYTGVE